MNQLAVRLFGCNLAVYTIAVLRICEAAQPQQAPIPFASALRDAPAAM
jgi:hypothetical protein